MGMGFVGEGETTFSVFIREGEREGGAFFYFWGGSEKRSCGYIPL